MLSKVRHFGNLQVYSEDHGPLNIHVRKRMHNISFVNRLQTRETAIKFVFVVHNVCSIFLRIFIQNNKYLTSLARIALIKVFMKYLILLSVLTKTDIYQQILIRLI
jgi:hypothetical protein